MIPSSLDIDRRHVQPDDFGEPLEQMVSDIIRVMLILFVVHRSDHASSTLGEVGGTIQVEWMEPRFPKWLYS